MCGCIAAEDRVNREKDLFSGTIFFRNNGSPSRRFHLPITINLVIGYTMLYISHVLLPCHSQSRTLDHPQKEDVYQRRDVVVPLCFYDRPIPTNNAYITLTSQQNNDISLKIK